MWYNPLVIWLLQSPLRGLMDGRTMLVTYTGRKSGKTYTTPVDYGREGSDVLMVSSRKHIWWRSLIDRPTIRLFIRGETLQGRAQVVEDSQSIADIFRRLYPSMSASWAASRLPELIAIRIELQPARVR